MGTLTKQRNNDRAPVSQEMIKKPYISGIVKNRRGTPLPGVLITILDKDNSEIRLLKSNPHGIFATYSPLAIGQYTLKIQDPNSVYFFDTIIINITEEIINPITIISKEML
jgi:hypothetical protein